MAVNIRYWERVFHSHTFLVNFEEIITGLESNLLVSFNKCSQQILLKSSYLIGGKSGDALSFGSWAVHINNRTYPADQILAKVKGTHIYERRHFAAAYHEGRP